MSQHPAPLAPQTIFYVFVIVSVCALAGMAMGGAFGAASGALAPKLFARMIPWQNLEPVGTATVLGGAVGVLLGGGLGVFGVFVMLAYRLLEGRRRPGM